MADGLFTDNGMFYVAPRVSTTPLEQLFRVRVIQMLVEEELLAPELARKLLGWKHSGFSVHNGKPLRREISARNWCRVRVNCRQPPSRPAPASTITQSAQFLTLGPRCSYRSDRNRGFHVAQQTCWSGVRESNFLLAGVEWLSGHSIEGSESCCVSCRSYG